MVSSFPVLLLTGVSNRTRIYGELHRHTVAQLVDSHSSRPRYHVMTALPPVKQAARECYFDTAESQGRSEAWFDFVTDEHKKRFVKLDA